jgi:photoactive yellow protein
MDFYDKEIIDWLSNSSPEELDMADFGIIGFNQKNLIEIHNETEAYLSGYKKEFVLGKNLFIDVAPCMNNYLVALKFEEKDEIDEIIPYILSFKVKPVSVELHLIKKKKLKLNYILIKRR